MVFNLTGGRHLVFTTYHLISRRIPIRRVLVSCGITDKEVFNGFFLRIHRFTTGKYVFQLVSWFSNVAVAGVTGHVIFGRLVKIVSCYVILARKRYAKIFFVSGAWSLRVAGPEDGRSAGLLHSVLHIAIESKTRCPFKSSFVYTDQIRLYELYC